VIPHPDLLLKEKAILSQRLLFGDSNQKSVIPKMAGKELKMMWKVSS